MSARRLMNKENIKREKTQIQCPNCSDYLMMSKEHVIGDDFYLGCLTPDCLTFTFARKSKIQNEMTELQKEIEGLQKLVEMMDNFNKK